VAPGGDRIELRGLRVTGHHGALPGEQRRAQPFELDLDLRADLGPARASDDLADTVDYGRVAEVAGRVVAEERHHLLEHLAHRVAGEVLACDPRLAAVTVTLRKLRPPLAVEGATAGVRVRARRPAPRGPRHRAFLGVGSNLGDRWATLRRAVAALPDVVAVSPVYETEPLGGPPGQGPHLNLVAGLWTRRSARDLLAVADRLERRAGRVRTEPHGPRTLDVDILVVEGEEVAEDDLVVPHPRLGERRFVLAPLADLDPDLVEDLVGRGGWDRARGEVRRLGSLAGPEASPGRGAPRG